MRRAGLASVGWLLAASLSAWAAEGPAPQLGQGRFLMNGRPADVSGSAGGFLLLTSGPGPQAALTTHTACWVASVRAGEELALSLPVKGLDASVLLAADAMLLQGRRAEVELSAGARRATKTVSPGQAAHLELRADRAGGGVTVSFVTRRGVGDAAVRWRGLRIGSGGRWSQVAIPPAPSAGPAIPPPALPALRPAIEREMIEADWRMQDGIDTPRQAATYAEAVALLLRRGGALVRSLRSAGADLSAPAQHWEALRREGRELSESRAGEAQWEDLWRRVHRLRRRIALSNPLAKVGPLLFVKQVPGSFSHQLTQYYGRYARAGGGIFVLDAPGESMACRQLAAGALGEGSYQQPEVSYDGRRVLFCFCTTDPKRKNARYYHLFEMAADGGSLRQLTDGAFDDFSPRYLPDGRIVFVSTRRGGYHRCGSPGCPVYTLAVCGADGSGVRLLSHHETQEWDPAVLHDGRIIYTRWDYVDRHAVFGEHLWTTRPDGTAPAALYGNLTRNPVGIWEAQPVPGSRKVMATAAAHHAMTAGSIVLVDADTDCDGLAPLTRLTGDVPFPESEFPVGRWSFPGAVRGKAPEPPENRRWPGHCYRTPWPLSEEFFLAAYSFDALVGEPLANRANMFGLYLADRFGNKELLYRDLNISSLWPVPLRPRRRPPVLPPQCDPLAEPQGTFVLRDVYVSSPALPAGSVRRLRITQVLPKTTQGRDRPAVGLAGGAPGKQVLGTVPVEPDGSAHFVAPAGVPLLFQALDERGQAVQVMRSATYLQPGETISCVGCHEPRTSSPPPAGALQALARAASRIRPGPDGSKPFSYPILVQPVLDRHCVRCHGGKDAPRGIVLTGQPQGHYTASYNALGRRVPYSHDTSSDSLSVPGRYGARGSSVMRMLLDKGHQKIVLTAEETERLATWMDTNALFYGTFDPADQQRQQRGERIEGPKLE